MKKKQIKEGKKTLDVIYLHAENKRRLELLHEQALLVSPTLKFHPFVESIIIDYLDSKESQKKFIHPIEFKAIVDQHIVLMDNLINKPVLVAMDESQKSLRCDSCGLDNCHHVGFVYGNQATSALLTKKGFFPSKKTEYPSAAI
ncbi:MAG TPA: hypothetical protein VNL34_04105 [Candidatus Nitrosotenuis sp.]|nr:hypothetical protein [Candidatus Nitrosotenuis sp.]